MWITCSTFNHKATCILLNVFSQTWHIKENHLVMNAPSGLTFMHTHSRVASLIWGRWEWPSLSQHESWSACHRPVRTMINDRNTRPRWSNVNRHPHSAGGAGNPYMATLWQWRMLGPSRACLASTSHLSYLSELSFQSIRQADIWMVFNILVGMACSGRQEAWICVCVWVWWGWWVRRGK